MKQPARPAGDNAPRSHPAKRFLRFMPRRAVLHRYPLIGRFAPQLRKRSHLWSFRREHVKSAYYAGAILALLPLFGIQMPLALVTALVLRANFMVLGGLQFITNPVTAAPVYFATHQLGSAILGGFNSTPPATVSKDIGGLGSYVAESIVEPLVGTESPPPRAGSGLRGALAAMSLGGALSGLVLAAFLDAADWAVRRRISSVRLRHAAERAKHRTEVHPHPAEPHRSGKRTSHRPRSKDEAA